LVDTKHSIDGATLISITAEARTQPLSVEHARGCIQIFIQTRHETQQLTYAQFLLNRSQLLLLPAAQSDFNHNRAEGAV
jgi:hypothetical protein